LEADMNTDEKRKLGIISGILFLAYTLISFIFSNGIFGPRLILALVADIIYGLLTDIFGYFDFVYTLTDILSNIIAFAPAAILVLSLAVILFIGKKNILTAIPFALLWIVSCVNALFGIFDNTFVFNSMFVYYFKIFEILYDVYSIIVCLAVPLVLFLFTILLILNSFKGLRKKTGWTKKIILIPVLCAR
jgi:hypothetical protein